MNVLDHGYCNLVESWGSDERIIESARMSTAKGFKGWGHKCECPVREPNVNCTLCKGKGWVDGDEKLLSYLWKNGHHTPFEMAGATFEIQAPIFVFRQWHRHRTQSYNEMSGRYVELPDLFYLPSIERLMESAQATVNKQGSEAGFDQNKAKYLQASLDEANMDARQRYETLLKAGVSKEVARFILPVAVYSRMRASANLRNWFHFLSLRLDPHAQFEIRVYADAICNILLEVFPRSTQLLMNDLYLKGI